MNNICIIDNALSDQDCDYLINNLKNKIQGSLGKPHNYNYCDIAYDENNILQNLTNTIIPKYKKLYPEIDKTHDKWKLGQYRFKEFIPSKYYDEFHSELSLKTLEFWLFLFIFLIIIAEQNFMMEKL